MNPGRDDEAGTGDRDGGGGGKAAQAPGPPAGPRYGAHGRPTVISVGRPGGLAISRVPSTEDARLARPARPVPRAGSAPPTPSSLMMTCSRSLARCTNTSAWLAWACLATLVRA